MVGGSGSDYYVVDNYRDVVIENANEGTDSVFVTGNPTGYLTTYYLPSNVENLYFGDYLRKGFGNNFNNLIQGNKFDNTIEGNGGNDHLYGNGGNDQLYGGDGTDDLYGGIGNDSLLGGNNNDSLNGEAGSDYLYGGLGQDILNGGADNDYLYGQEGQDTLTGGSGADRFYIQTDNTRLTDTITDFSRESLDKIYLLGTTVSSFRGYSTSPALNAVTYWRSGYDTIVSFNNNGSTHDIILKNYSGEFTASEIIF